MKAHSGFWKSQESPLASCGIWVTDRTQDGGRRFCSRIGGCGVFNFRQMSHLFRRQNSEIIGGCLGLPLRGGVQVTLKRGDTKGLSLRSPSEEHPFTGFTGVSEMDSTATPCVQASEDPSSPVPPPLDRVLITAFSWTPPCPKSELARCLTSSAVALNPEGALIVDCVVYPVCIVCAF